MIDLILGALCEVRSDAHANEHGGVWADSAYHVSQGERPTCGLVDEHPSETSQSDSGDGGKSRYCSKRWFC